METPIQPSSGNKGARTGIILGGLAIVFLGLVGLFLADVWGHPPAKQKIPLVDAKFLEPKPWRQSYADLVKAKEDLSDYDCYACHEKNKPPPIRYDDNHKIIVPKEHQDVEMGHGSHDRNNLCYNCHNEANLLTLQTRDGRELKFDNSPPLCGSCHGPTYRDWEYGVHGRISGYWNKQLGEATRLMCVNCHNPHKPTIPTREPAPAPHALREQPAPASHNPKPAH